MRIRYFEQFTAHMEELKIELSDVCFVTSVSMTVSGIRENNDIEFVLSTKARKKLEKHISKYEHNNFSGFIRLDDKISCVEGTYELFDIADDELFTDEYSIDYNGCRVVKTELYYAKKILQNRDKDIRDAEKIRSCIAWTDECEERAKYYLSIAEKNGYSICKNRDIIWWDLKEKPSFLIFGTGYAAKNVFDRITKEGFENNVKGFIVSYFQKENFMNRPVFNFCEIMDKSIPVLICVDFCTLLSVREILEKNGFTSLIDGFCFWT